ncbi:apolipophorins isoform X2 [Manduca sexta]|uniref:apolipophorins isoform X2 n=1 Tax=Manduca sexta TaxID=7130 RepID=UPI00188EBDFC|nr:apolipophorins isoform X2 [Manduca sexta]
MGKSNRLLSVLFVISVLWKAAYGNGKCQIACKGSSSPSFAAGQKYNYGVEGTVSVYLTGADNQETSLKMLGQASVSAISNCELELSVHNMVLSGPDGKKYPCPQGIEKPVRFSYQDGRVGPEICAAEDDSRRSLNIKRAIISLLQAEQKPSVQVDVFGVCPTEVSSSQEGGAVLLHRSRDLSRCAHREQGRNDFVNSIANPDAGIKDLQVLQSMLNVESKVNNGVPEKVSAIEEYLYKPFSVGENGARAKVHTKLTLSGKGGAGGGNAHCTESRSIIFDVPHGTSSANGNLNSVISAVKETARTVANDASSKSAGQFAQLVRIMRTSSKDDLMRIYSQVKAHQLEKRVYLDALLRVGTGESIEASIQILKSKDLSQLEQHLVFLSLGNARHVNNPALKAAAGLLDMPNLPKEVYLGAGALGGAYCREHDCHNVKPEGIVALSNKLGSKLQNCRPKNKPDEDVVVAILKGIRNIRHLEDSLIDKLVHCAVDNNVKARVRAAALEAFHADPCSAKIHKTAMDIMKNRQLDSEIRIKAYLAVIECPCSHSASEIKNLLDSEPVHQVGNFITSSLRHIRSSSNPDKQLAKKHYGQIRTPNKFKVDERKYSFYREMSYKLDALGAGGSVDQTVIYSQTSFLPRSVNFNLTVDLFGQSYNVMELGGRQGNLDRVVEHFLGPKSFLRTEDPQALYDNLVKRFQESKKKVEDSLSRGRRSIKSEIDVFDKNLKAESAPYNNELDLDIYVKLFGTDAVFLSFGDDKGFDFNKMLDQILGGCNSGINKAKHFQQEIRSHLLFMDAELAYPTSVGLPLRLNLIGAATARLDVATNIDIRQIFQSPQNAKADIKFVPSTDFEISGAFIIDADAFSTGIKVITNLHSSTGVHVNAKVLENGRGIDLQIGLPVDKQELIAASSDLVFVTAEKGQKEKQKVIKMEKGENEYSACFDQLSGPLGLTMCYDMVLPFPIVNRNDKLDSIAKAMGKWPLSGSAKFKLFLEKNDLRGYHIKAVVKEDKDAGRRSFELLLDTEGAKTRRSQLTGEAVYNENEVGVKLGLEAVGKVIYGHIWAHKKPNELVASVKGKLDDIEYSGKLGFSVQGNEHRAVYKPIFEYSLPDGSSPGSKKYEVKIDGQVIRECDGRVTKYTFDGVHVNLQNAEKPLEICGSVSTVAQPREVEFDVEVKHYASLKGSWKGSDVVLAFNNQLNPKINFDLKGKFENTDSMHNELDIHYGPNRGDNNARITFSQILKYHVENSKNFNVITKNNLEIRAVPFKLVANADVDPKKIDIDIEGQLQDKSAGFNLDARTHIKKEGDYSIKVKANLNNANLEAFSRRDIVSAEKSNVENYIDMKGVGRYELSGFVLHKTKPNDVNVGFIGHLKINGGGKNEDFKINIGHIETPAVFSSHATISGSRGDIIDYLLKIMRTANPSGNFKLVIKDSIAANGQYKVTDADGKGNGLIIIDFKKINRKIKGDVRFTAKEPVFNADIDLFLNFEKDNSDKVHFSTYNKKTDKVMDTKNKLEYAGKRTEVNIHQDGILAVTGKAHTVAELVLPTERCLSLKIDRDGAFKDGLYNGHMDMTISDAPKRGSGASTISYKGKVSNSNFDQEIIDYEGQLNFKLKDGKNLQSTFSLKNNPDGDKFKYEFKSDVNGNLIPKPANLVATGTYSNSETEIDETYRLKGSYGSDIGFELAGVGTIKFLDAGDKKYLDDYTLTVRLPFEKAHDIKWVSTVLFLQPQGQEITEYTLVESVQINADVYKVDANGKVGPKNGYGAVKVLVPHVEPFVLDYNYKSSHEGEKNNNYVELKTKYGKGKSASMVVDSSYAPHYSTLKVKANTPNNDKFKKLDVTVHSKNPSPDAYSSSVVVDADGRVYKIDSSIVLSKAHPVLDIQYHSPSSDKIRRLYVQGSSLSSTQGKLEVKVDNINDICLDAVSEANVQKDNVAFKVVANSKELGWKNYVIDISSKDSGSGKRLEFHATNDNKNVLSGSTSFISKQEGQKTIIEGSGSVKVKEEQKSANFKYIRTVFTDSNEKGVETFFNVALGERSYVAESRVTNYEYKNSYVYCEEKKQCAHAEIQSKIDMSTPGMIVNVINAGLDLRKLGVAPEIGLQMRDEVSDRRPPRFTLDLHINKEDRKYHLHAYNTPENGHYASGVTVRLPSRVMALEYTLTHPTSQDLPFPIKGEACLDLDKNRPGHKTSARFLVDYSNSGSEDKAVAEIGFFHPKIEKEAVIRLNAFMKRPENGCFKIESSASLCHSALGTDRVAKVMFETTPNSVKFLADTPFVKAIDVEGSFNVNQQQRTQQCLFKICLLEGKPVQMSALVKDYQYYEFTTEESNRKLSIVGHLIPEKRVDISADIILSGDKKNIAHGALFLQDNLVKSDYGLSKENFNYFLNALKKDLDTLEDRIKNVGEKASKDVEAVTQRAAPYFKKVEDNFRAEWNRFYQEIADDKVFKEISHVFNEIVQYIAKFIDEILQGTKPLMDSIVQTYVESSKKIGEMYKKQIEPQVKQLYDTLGALMKEYLDGVIDVVAHFAAIVTDFFEKHKAELQELTNVFTEIFKDLTRLVVAQLKELPPKIAQIYNDIVSQITNMPFVVVLQEKWKEFNFAERAVQLVSQAYEAISKILPTDELKEFAKALNAYLLKKIKEEKMEESKELRVLYEKLVSAFSSLRQFLPSQYGDLVSAAGPGSISSWLFAPAPSAPALGAASWSALRQLAAGDAPDPRALLEAYRPRSLDPLDEVPNKLRAVVVNGQHIFTFDGRHLTFPGTCRYVLIHDHVDRNFTVLMQLANGQPKALVLEDKSGTIIELKDNGQVILNGQSHGFPVVEQDVFAFRQTSGRIGLGSKYGLMAFCTSKFEVCYFEVNGFYLGKLRGLLGDGNNEPYDDFRMPNGKICSSESEFGNSYRLSRSCPAANAPAHEHHQMHAPLPKPCERVFSGTSPLRPLSLMLDIAPFRQACIHAVTGADADKDLQQACDLARGYAALALTGLLPAALPDACVRCTDGDRPREVGETYEYKLPNRLADIVISVETTEDNAAHYKNMVVPLVSQLVDMLKGKHCTDIKVFLVGHTSKHPYPILYDTDLKLKNAKVSFDDKSRYDRIPFVKTGHEKFDSYSKSVVDFLNYIKIELGITNIEASQGQIFDLPLRPGAVKHAIFVTGGPTISQFFLLETVRALANKVIIDEMAMSASLVTSTPGLKIGGGKNPAQIVGYEKHGVLLLGEKKQSKDSEAVRATLEVEDDPFSDAVEFANGVVFSASNYAALPAGQQKQFIQTAAHNIIQRMWREQIVQQCTCVFVDPFRVRSVCFNKARTEVARRRK